MTKKWRMIFYAIPLFLFLQGCNTNNDEVNSPPEEAPVEQEATPKDNEQNQADEQQNGQSDENQDAQKNEPLFAFTSFDLDVEYKDNQSYEVDYENEKNGMEAEIEDQRNNEKVSGDEAFEQLRPIFENFSFDQNTAKDEVISEVLKAFELNADYTKFELDIDFADGTKKEYKG
ncbi:YusW family protein [Mesobacillus maritimus]|uniref:YusW family protein n=1 Tax=Mesobacillus maritimus TaxID=1643336 RepID=UPI00203BF8BE|nr:YusW family protein [Mesobacillus maritimus]MCM3585817.1 YusW family protein [Mesobacillus maritimus]MCM3670577.1 YusW family protein [Mesobacillus maritimus]